MPDSKGEELQIILQFEVSTEVRGERFADQNITGMQGNIGQKSFFQKKRKLLLEKTRNTSNCNIICNSSPFESGIV
jgi:hypothetical protein